MCVWLRFGRVFDRILTRLRRLVRRVLLTFYRLRNLRVVRIVRSRVVTLWVMVITRRLIVIL